MQANAPLAGGADIASGNFLSRIDIIQVAKYFNKLSK